MPIKTLQFTDAGPFENIGFEFDDHVNVLTGANNSGKSTVLCVLGEVLVYPFALPMHMLRSNQATWSIQYSSGGITKSISGELPADTDALVSTYKDLGYTCFIPAQRFGTQFRSSGPTVGMDREKRAQQEVDLVSQFRTDIRRQGHHDALLHLATARRNVEDPELAKRSNLMLAGTSLVADDAMIQKIIDIDYAAYRTNHPETRNIVNQIFSMASQVTEGFPISFMGVGEDEDGLYPQLGTPDGELPLNYLSQGTQSIIHSFARFMLGYAEYYGFPDDLRSKPGVLIIDEIDAHLHPSWQRRMIPTLTNNFPNLQIFCASHSPLMLAGLERGQVQLLTRHDQGGTTVSSNETDIVGWTADEILRNFLNTRNPTDAETARRIDRLDQLRHIENLSDEQSTELEHLRQTIGPELLHGPGAAQIEEFAEQLRRARGSGSPNIPAHDEYRS